MWSDNETTLDMIGFDVHAKLLKEVILNANLLPMTIGVFGDWGSGKTSILKMLEEKLNDLPEEQGVVCLYFNSWVFEGFEDAKSAIISSVLSQLAEHRTFGAKIKENMGKVVKSINWMKLAKMGVSIGLPIIGAQLSGGLSIIPTILNLFASAKKAKPQDGLGQQDEKGEEKDDEQKDDGEPLVNIDKLLEKQDYDDVQLYVRKFREDFENLICKSTIKTLVILIDDLDRCSPERIVDNLEAIKLFLNVRQTAFVIGADPRIVRHAVAVRYKDVSVLTSDKEGFINEYSTNDLIGDYIEKLIQVPYYLPKLSPAEIETYMSLLFCTKELDGKTMETILSEHKKYWESNRFGIFGEVAIKKLLGETQDKTSLYNNLSFCSSSASLITEGLKGNPRQVKRFLNAYVLRKILSSVSNMHGFKDNVLVKLMILEYAKPKIFNYLYKIQVEQSGFPTKIKEIEDIVKEKGNSVLQDDIAKVDNTFANDFCIKWFKMPPYFSDIDLRDYFWITRDRLQNTMVGVTFISPAIKRVFEDLVSDNPGKINSMSEVIRGFADEDRVILFDCLKDHIKRNPSKKNGYDAIKALVEKQIVNSVDLLKTILVEVPSDKLPAAFGVDISSLYKQNIFNCRIVLSPLIDKLKEERSMFGRALKKDVEV